MAPALQMFMTPVIGITCFAIILLNWFGGVKYGKIPAGLVAIAAGSIIAWGSTALGLNFGGMTAAALSASVTNFGFHVPLPAFSHVLDVLPVSGEDFWSPPFRSAFTIWWKPWTTWKARRSPATVIPPLACSAPTAS